MSGTGTVARNEERTALTLRAEQTGFDATQLAALRQIGLADAPMAEIDTFFHVAKRSGLDPFARQVYMIPREDRRSGGKRWTIQTSIDGYRLIARRAADAAREVLGYEDLLWCGPDGQWVDVWLADVPPVAAKVVVLRGTGRFPAVALWKEYAGQTATWRSMPALMLAKCAEALALRRAFPADLSGLYTAEEMAQADRTATAPRPAPAPAESLDPGVLADLVAAAQAAAGDSDALKRVWYDARAVGALHADVEVDGTTGSLGDLIKGLATVHPVVDAEIVTEDPPAGYDPETGEVLVPLDDDQGPGDLTFPREGKK